MRGKLARRQRALQRSQQNTRLSRKAATVALTAHEQELDRLLAAARDDRAEAMKDANAAYTAAVDAADKTRRKQVQAADAAYIEKRDAIIKRLAGEQAAA